MVVPSQRIEAKESLLDLLVKIKNLGYRDECGYKTQRRVTLGRVVTELLLRHDSKLEVDDSWFRIMQIDGKNVALKETHV